jgi:lipopolysaccharide transport system permease protein
MSIWRHRSLVVELTKREFQGKYSGSSGGVIWSFIQPLFLLSVYTLAFGVILKNRWGSEESTVDYALMLFAGLIVFNSFSEVLARSSTLITANPNFVKKIVFPLELLPVISVLTALAHAFIGVIVWILGYIILVGPPRPTFIFFPFVFLCFIPVLLGVSWLLASVGVVFKDVSQIVGMLNHTLLFLTPIFYSIEVAPAALQKFLMVNPLTLIIEQLRSCMFVGMPPDFSNLVIYFSLASSFAWLCLSLFKRLRPTFADLI